MNQPCEAEVAPKLFECFLEREQSGLPTDVLPSAIGALLAGRDLLRAAGHSPGSEWPEGWFKVPSTDCFHRCCHETKYVLEVYKFGDYWFALRANALLVENLEALVLAFEQVPICTDTFQEAMRLADHCHPNPGLTMGGCWVRALVVK
jgi:hypothetical protein